MRTFIKTGVVKMRVEESTIGNNQEIDSQNTEYPAMIT